MLAMVWYTISGGGHYPLDGSTSIVQLCVRARVCTCVCTCV